MWMFLWGEMRRRWPEYLAVVAAVGLVVTALVAQRAAAGAAHETMHELAHRLGRNMLVVPAAMDLGGFHRQQYGDAFLPDDAPAALLRSPAGPHLRAIQARLYGRADVGQASVLLVGETRSWPAAPGGLVPAVLGAEAARRLGAGRGSRLEAGPLALSVMDVVADADGGLDEAVFVPLEAGQRILGRPGQVNALRPFNLVPYLTCEENVALPALLAGRPRAEAFAAAREVLGRLGLSPRRRHRPAELSVGERQRASVGRALVNGPSLFLADEPTGNLDPAATADVMGLFREIHAAGRTVVMVTHDPALAEVADRVVCLRAGAVVEDRFAGAGRKAS